MLILGEFFKTKSDKNNEKMHQNTPTSCTLYSKFSRGSYHMLLNTPSICVQP